LLPYSGHPNGAIWKVGGFGLEMVAYVSASSTGRIYNIKPSTEDPLYSAPEFAIEGRFYQLKHIWSLGGIFVEVLLWPWIHPALSSMTFKAKMRKPWIANYIKNQHTGTKTAPDRQISIMRWLAGSTWQSVAKEWPSLRKFCSILERAVTSTISIEICDSFEGKSTSEGLHEECEKPYAKAAHARGC
jgi:hypothetical protein